MSDTLAAVDVGTNSFHLVVARVVDDHNFEVVTQEKFVVRLGSGGGDMKRLEPDAIDRGVEALTRFHQIAESAGAPVRAVATSAVREALNAEDFLSRARTEAGIDVEVISGQEEARLIHLGVLQSLDVFERPLLLCDIGGGSTEMLLGYRGEVRTSRSFKLGAVRLTDRFFPGNLDHPGAVYACRRFVRAALSPMIREVQQIGFEVAVGSSGTIEQLAILAHRASGRPPLRSYANYELTRDALSGVIEDLVRAGSVTERRRLSGLDEKRADIILAGALIFEQVVESFGIESVLLSGFALREGVLLDTLQRSTGGMLHHLQDVSRRSVMALMKACDEEPEHSERVSRLALRLFDITSDLHGLHIDTREYLEAAALLANVGLVISHSKHHLHSYYVIRNSERLLGFTDGEIEIIAQVARYHRKSGPKSSHSEFARLRPHDQQVVRILAALLRVAIGLDRSHKGVVTDVEARLEPPGLELRVHAEGDANLDIYAASERRDLLEAVLEMPVTLVPALG